MVTLSCGHSQCARCTKKAKCCTCLVAGKVVPSVDLSTFVCAGCNRHYINHYDTVINQVRILKCGHRRMCNHLETKCRICTATAVELSVDVAMTALVCRVHIADPSLPVRARCTKSSCLACMRCLPCIGSKSKYENI